MQPRHDWATLRYRAASPNILSRVFSLTRRSQAAHAAAVSVASASRRAAELTVLRSEVDQLVAARVSSDEATALRIASLHEEKAAQQTSMARIIDSLQRQLSASESQVAALRGESHTNS